jgi:hypothetical protein
MEGDQKSIHRAVENVEKTHASSATWRLDIG